MAITDLDVFAHLTDADIENLGLELDAIRQDIKDSRGERDYRYIHRTIAAQRALEVAGRVMLAASSRHPGGVNVAFADGSVHFVKSSVSPISWYALATVAGGEVLSSDSY